MRIEIQNIKNKVQKGENPRGFFVIEAMRCANKYELCSSEGF